MSCGRKLSDSTMLTDRGSQFNIMIAVQFMFLNNPSVGNVELKYSFIK